MKKDQWIKNTEMEDGVKDLGEEKRIHMWNIKSEKKQCRVGHEGWYEGS